MIAELQDSTWVVLLRTDNLTTYFKLFPIFGKPAFYVFVFAAWFWLKGGKNCIFFVFAALFASVANGLLKIAIQIPRPPAEIHLINAGSFGFPSGDAQLVATMFFLFAFFYGRISLFILALLLTLNSMLSRVYLGVHSPLDVMVGASLGFLTAYAFSRPVIYELITNWALGRNLRIYWGFVGACTLIAFGLYFSLVSTPLAIALGSLYGLGVAFTTGKLHKTRNTSPYVVLVSITTLAILYIVFPSTFISGPYSWANEIAEFFFLTLFIFHYAPRLFDAVKKDRTLRHV